MLVAKDLLDEVLFSYCSGVGPISDMYFSLEKVLLNAIVLFVGSVHALEAPQ